VLIIDYQHRILSVYDSLASEMNNVRRLFGCVGQVVDRLVPSHTYSSFQLIWLLEQPQQTDQFNSGVFVIAYGWILDQGNDEQIARLNNEHVSQFHS